MQYDGYWDKERVQFQDYNYEDKTLIINAEMISPFSNCPKCNQDSSSIHSRYQRYISDLPFFGSQCYINLKVRRFFCTNTVCERQIFCERLDNIAEAYARKSERLIAGLTAIGFEIAGNTAKKLCAQLGMKISANSVNRLLRSCNSRPNEKVKVRVLGVDDWALCRGQRYGTLLVDLEKHEVIDALENRDANTLSAWLKKHPEIEIVSRDRSGDYAKAVKESAPQAIEVADRWHLLKNLREMLERYLQTFSTEIKAVQDKEIVLPTPNLSSRKEEEKQANYQRRLKQFQSVHKLFKEGYSKSQIARELCLARGTVIRYLNLEILPQTQRRSAMGKLKPHLEKIHQCFLEGQTISQIWRAIKSDGFAGKRAMVKRYIQYLKTLTVEQFEFLTSNKIKTKVSVKNLSYALLKDKDDISESIEAILEHLRKSSEAFEFVEKQAIDFATMLKSREPDNFYAWLKTCCQSSIPQLKNFAIKMKQDQEAVHNAMKYHWSNGQLEGQINRVKTIKRQLYGRANFDLLKARILHSS